MKKFLFLIIVSSLFQVSKSPSQVIPRDIVDRVNRSPYIFEGEVIRVNGYWNGHSNFIYTQVTVDIKKILKGDLICGTDIVINNLYDTLYYADTSKSNPIPPGKFDFYQLILHELGHAHSLTHVNDTNSVMWYGATKSGIPAANRRITLMNDQVAVNGGNYVTSNAYLIDTVQCPVIRMGIGSTNCSAIGIGEIDSNINLNLYPNPASDKLYITYDLEKQSTITIAIFDLQGRQIYMDVSKQVNLNGIKEIPVQTFNDGYYLVKICIGQSSFATKLIKR